METPVPGQRWVSKTEADLGLGVVLKVEYGRIEIFFPAANELRQYALKTAPLQRVHFQDGDTIKTHTGESFSVTSVVEKAGLLVYHCGKTEIPEAQLADTISFSKPEDRLLAGQIDDLRTSDLRSEALKFRSETQKSPVRGFVGGRVDLLPHQMFIANEVSSRVTPRVLLADEVGLGKTIEAGLILHRLHLTGRANRVLILVPDALVNQWFVELLRRFNLVASVIDEERCTDLESDDPEGNPYLSCQIAISAINYIAGDEERTAQCLEAGWDLLIVDEAHHLEWSPDTASAAYDLVDALAAETSGLLLLTATPQQLGPEGHFARLRLLDPERYDSLEKFKEEAEQYSQTAAAVDRILAGEALTEADNAVFSQKSERVKKLSESLVAGNSEETRQQLVACLLDEFGTGRVMFRNTRAALKGFPERKAHLVPLNGGDDPDAAKVKWLAGLLKELGTAKVLLICRTRELAEATQEKLLHEINVSIALFHEDMSLVQRDRAAVHFADEEGARILLCSEIGSEGRNFQFAHHLVLYDLPENPELLEQRIGRLDRIGQTATIEIHVPYAEGTAGEMLARWYHEGLNAFEKHPHGAMEILEQLGGVSALCEEFDAKMLKALIKNTQSALKQVAAKLEKGHDRLLEMTSFKAEGAQKVIEAVHALDDELDFDDFIIRLMDRLGIVVEEHGHRSYVFRPGDLMTDALPSLPPEGMFVTFDRERALSRENIGYFTIDHPTVRGAIDYVLGGELGNTSFGIWKGSGSEGILLDLNFVVDCIAPAALHVDRFLSAVPIRVIIDHAMTDLSENEDAQTAGLTKGDPSKLLDNGPFRKKLMPSMLKKAQGIAATRMKAIVAAATEQMTAQIDTEVERLEDLARINNYVRPEEAEKLRQSKDDLLKAIGGAELRLDMIRLVLKTK